METSVLLLSTAVLSIALLALRVALAATKPSELSRLPPAARSGIYPFIGALHYFDRCWEWGRLERSRVIKDPFQAYSFSLGRKRVVAISGTAARQWLFNHPTLCVVRGYQVTYGGMPDFERARGTVDAEGAPEPTSEFAAVANHAKRRLKGLITAEYLEKVLPIVFSVAQNQLNRLGDKGRTNPFESIDLAVFAMSVRTIGCREIADSPEKADTFLRSIHDIEDGNTALSVAYSWIPTRVQLRKVAASVRLYRLTRPIVRARQTGQTREDDALQHVVGTGDSALSCVFFLVSALHVASNATGLAAAWLLSFLGASQEWQQRIRDEVVAAARKWGDEDADLVSQLAKIPLEGWEKDFPAMDRCLRESIRLVVQMNMPRYNGGPAITLGDYVVPTGSFFTYPINDVHQDPELYPNPRQFDPDRFLRGHDKEKPIGYLGWGAGRHNCLGKRLAEFQIKIMVSSFLARYDWDVTLAARPDARALTIDELPLPSLNALSTKPPPEPVLLRYRKRVDLA